MSSVAPASVLLLVDRVILVGSRPLCVFGGDNGIGFRICCLAWADMACLGCVGDDVDDGSLISELSSSSSLFIRFLLGD